MNARVLAGTRVHVAIALGSLWFAVCTTWRVSAQPGPLFVPLPLYVPSSPETAATPERVDLGRLLFWDPILSGEGDVACATCHHPDHGYADGRDLSVGVGGVGLGHGRRFAGGVPVPPVKRNSQTILNVAFNGWTDAQPISPAAAPMFWDARVRGLEAQALVPIESLEEMRGHKVAASKGVEAAVARLAAVPEYAKLFRRAFGGEAPVSAQNVGRALAVFERTLITPMSPFDRYLRGDKRAMGPDQVRGLDQFITAGCDQCHAGPMLSDFKIHTLGTPPNGKLEAFDSGVVGSYGFRTPTLRNLSYTAPYMHNGVFATLDEVMAFYLDLQTGRSDGRRHPSVPASRLAPLLFEGDASGERKDIVAFLEALDDPAFDRTVPARVPSGLRVGGSLVDQRGK